MYQNENLHSSSITLVTSRNPQLTLITVEAGSKTAIYKILIYKECINENAIFMQFYVILSDIHPDLHNWP